MATLARKIAGFSLLLVLLGVAVLVVAFSSDTACAPSATLTAGATPMKAVLRRCYGPPDVLSIENIEKPVPADKQLLVKVRAAAVNPFDWHYIRGKPYLMRIETGVGTPRNPRIGVDFAGTVEAVGKDVTRFKPGDEVFGGKFGAFAEYLTIAEDGMVAAKPTNLTFEQAGGVNIAAMTALQALRDRGQIKPGHQVLINGASGGVGTFAVQIAKSLGAEVAGVCSTRNVEMVRSIGADHVFDYTREDFTESGRQYDVILDNVGNRALLDIRRVLKPDGKYILIGGGGPEAGPWIGVFIGAIKAFVLSQFVDQDMGMFLSESNADDLATLRDLMAAGKITPVIDREYPLAEAAEAIRYLEEGHARGKVIITFD